MTTSANLLSTLVNATMRWRTWVGAGVAVAVGTGTSVGAIVGVATTTCIDVGIGVGVGSSGVCVGAIGVIDAICCGALCATTLGGV